MKFLIFLLLSTSVLALKPHQAIYALSVSDFKIADVQIVLGEKKGIYTYTLNAKTKGLVALLKDYELRSKSIFILDKKGVKSQRYQNFERDGDRVKKDIDISLEGRQLDPLNQTLDIAHQLKKNPSRQIFDFLLNNGKKLTKEHYRQIENRHKNLISIVSEDGNIEIHFDKNQYFLPTLIRNKNFTYQLKSIQF